MKTLKELNEELDAFNATLNDENEDAPELLAEQERLLAAVTAAEAADLPSLSANALIAHFNKRAPSEHLAKGLFKAGLIAKIEALPKLTPEPTPEPTPDADPQPESFNVAGYALAHGLDAREVRKKLRAAGLRAPYTLEQVEKVMGS
jgi:cell division septation protein DedD